MGAPGWLLELVIGFLEERTLIVSYKGEKSGVKEMPGGGPQGTILGMFLFLVLINDAGFKNERESVGLKITKAVNKRTELEAKHWKYVDDLTVAEALKLKESLTNDDNNVLEKPHTFHNRTNQVLPDQLSKVHKQLQDIQEYAKDNEMKVNQKKFKIMLFNTARKHDFTPTLKINDEQLEVVEEIKLLGVKVTDDLKCDANTKYITAKGYSRLWMLRRLKALGASKKELVDCYLKLTRSILEYCSVVWQAGLTQANRADLEIVQKSACAIILGKEYVGYQTALENLGLEKLEARRVSLSTKFAKKAFKSKKYSNWFVPDSNPLNTRRKVQHVKEAQCRTRRFQNSALPYLTKLLKTDASK